MNREDILRIFYRELIKRTKNSSAKKIKKKRVKF